MVSNQINVQNFSGSFFSPPVRLSLHIPNQMYKTQTLQTAKHQKKKKKQDPNAVLFFAQQQLGNELKPQFPLLLDTSASMCQKYQTMLWLLLLGGPSRR